MSLHPPRGLRIIDLGKPKPSPAPRLTINYCGMNVSYAHSRRPRILRLEVSKPRPGSKEMNL